MGENIKKESLAERGGFEPPSGYDPEHAFQACDLNRSSISPKVGNFNNALKLCKIQKMIRLVFFLLFLSACAAPPLQVADSRSTRSGADVVIFALGLLDTGYTFGGKNPSAGLDCSGMVTYVYKEAIQMPLKGNAASLAKQGKKISTRDLRPGDLVFFNTQNRPFSHVGIFLGKDQFIHAPNAKGKVRVEKFSSSYWQKRLDGARSFF